MDNPETRAKLNTRHRTKTPETRTKLNTRHRTKTNKKNLHNTET